MTLRDFALPDLGEGLTESEIVVWRVSIGDTIELNQIIAEVETAKALVELPSPFAGVVSEFYADAGATVAVGSPILAVDVADADAASDVSPGDAGAERSAASGAAPVGREPVLVGYGPPVEGGARPHRRARTRDDESAPSSGTLRSTPPVRALARELGVDLTAVVGTGDGGLVTRDDVRAVAAASGPTTASGLLTARPPDSAGSLDAERPAREIRRPISGVRKHTATAMVASAFTAPHVTEFLTIDVTPAVELLDRLRSGRAFSDHRLTMLTLVAKALCVAVDRTPAVNSRWDEASAEIVQFGYVNLGIAAATPRGLMVPNLKDADRLPFTELATALTGLVETARAGRSSPSDLSGGTITITNIGVFGIDAGTPILNPGEAAILAIGAVKRMPWEHRGQIALREVMTLSLSFDHRLVDGEQGSRFLSDIGTILSDPGMLLTMI